MAKLKTDFTKQQLTPVADIGEKRNEEAKRLGTFKNTTTVSPSGHFSDAEPKTQIDKFYETFASKERSHYGA